MTQTTRTPANKGRKYPAQPFTTEDMRKLLKAARGRGGPAGIRNCALIVLAWRTGLRCSECLGLIASDIDIDEQTVRVRHGKGDKARVVGFDTLTASALGEWMAMRKKLGVNGRKKHPVFCTISKGDDMKPGGAMSTAYVRAMMIRLGQRAGLEREQCNFHSLRHSFASDALTEGWNVETIRKGLGHSRLNTTAKYLDHLCPQAVIQTMKDRPNPL